MTLGARNTGRFARRTEWDRSASEGPSSVAPGDAWLDLTVSNPGSCGFALDGPEILDPLSDPGALRYRPEPKGLLPAREAVAQYYAGHGAKLSPEQILLTASTSEGYSHLFRLLCDPGDEVLIAQPSYPLFDTLADLSDVVLRSYPLFYDHGWWIDVAALERAITSRTRALVIVHPNNPTGHATSAGERQRIDALCRRYGLSLIVDEVFLDYGHRGFAKMESFATTESFATAPGTSLTFVLSGLSKIAALPQMKVGWIVVLGDKQERDEALERLEIIADTFLSVSAPAQLALPAWLRQAPAMQRQIMDRIDGNLAFLRGAGMEVLEVAAGWSAILRLPRVFDDDSAFDTLRKAGILTHPAHFYGLNDASRVVISLIVPGETMQRAADVMTGLLRRADAR